MRVLEIYTYICFVSEAFIAYRCPPYRITVNKIKEGKEEAYHLPLAAAHNLSDS